MIKTRLLMKKMRLYLVIIFKKHISLVIFFLKKNMKHNDEIMFKAKLAYLILIFQNKIL